MSEIQKQAKAIAEAIAETAYGGPATIAITSQFGDEKPQTETFTLGQDLDINEFMKALAAAAVAIPNEIGEGGDFGEAIGTLFTAQAKSEAKYARMAAKSAEFQRAKRAAQMKKNFAKKGK